MKGMSTLLCLVVLEVPGQSAVAQWSTSTRAQEALFACEGFDHDLMTFDDGSSFVTGALSSYILLQKLDPYGYVVWPSPVTVMQNDSSDIFSPGRMYSDGNQGVFVVWADHRHAILQETGYLNYSLYGQHVDRNGSLLWPAGGIEIVPASHFMNGGAVTPDMDGGLLHLEIDEVDSGFPSTYVTRMSLFRMNAQGNRDWEVRIDSGTGYAFEAFSCALAGTHLYVSTWRRNKYETLVFNTSTKAFHFEKGSSSFALGPDSLLFRASYAAPDTVYVYRYNARGSIDWWTALYLSPQCAGYVSAHSGADLIHSDNAGGIYFAYFCGDSIFHVDSLGNVGRRSFPGLSGIWGYRFSDGHGGLVAISDTSMIAQRWNNHGLPVWPESFRVITDCENVYSPFCKGDNNGGILVAYWTTLGGIRVQHTGRTGKIGFLTSVSADQGYPREYVLHQNYPNPFNPTTVVSYELPVVSSVRLVVYDILGREVVVLVNERQEAGVHKVKLDAPELASGVYVYRLTAGRYVESRKMLLLK